MKKLFLSGFIFLLSFVLFSETYQKDLSLKSETVLISLLLEDSNIMSVCIGSENEYIVFRMGKPDNIELIYPENKSNSWQIFSYEYYFRGGGPDNEGVDLNYLLFSTDESSFEIFEEYTSDSESAGIKITKQKAEETILKGEILKGSLIPLRFDYQELFY